MSCSDWPNRDHHYELCCYHADCETLLTEVATLREAFEALRDHDRCRPTTVLIMRRGWTPAKKRSRWSVWLHRGPHIEADAEAA